MKQYNYGTVELRAVYKQYCKASRKAIEDSIWGKPYQAIPFPEQCRGMRCGAKTRKGTPCKLSLLYSNGRCKFHGGMSTGPRTAAGKAKSASNGKRRQV